MGGWEQWCQEVADALIARGHEVIVLTSRYRAGALAADPPHVRRQLYLESDLHHYRPVDFFLRLPARDRHNTQFLEDAIERVKPDAMMIWGMWQLSAQLAVHAEQLVRDRVAYYFCGFWPALELEPDPHTAYWRSLQSKLRSRALGTAVTAPAFHRIRRRQERRPDLAHVACVSQYVLDTFRSAGFGNPTWRVIYGGIDLESFTNLRQARSPVPTGMLRLVYAGSLSREKGVGDVVSAMTLVARRLPPESVHVTLVGSGHPDFEAELHRLVSANELDAYVSFRGRIPKQEMPALLAQFDVLLFTSAWEEPLARMMMEGMAAGLALITTVTGGTGEAVTPGTNALTFAPGNAEELAAQIERLANDPDLVRRLAEAGQQTAIRRFSLHRMTDDLEAFLQEVAGGPNVQGIAT
jgi:glycogen(starch) synthase